MTIEQWSLGALKSQIREEFGLTDNAQLNILLNNKANQAQQDIVRYRPNWPWQRKEISLDITDDTTALVAVNRGETRVSMLSFTGEAPTVRQVLIVTGATGDQIGGYLINNVFATSGGDGFVDIQSQYRGSTTFSSEARFQTAYIELPDDFIRFDVVSDLDDLTGDRIRYVSPAQFEAYKRQLPGPGIGLRWYTVKSDPLGESTIAFISLFPYYSTLSTIQGEYFRSPPKLVSDGDIPIVPPNDRAVMFYHMAWYYSVHSGNQRASFYQSQALAELERMGNEYEMSDDLDYEAEVSMWIPGPANYPHFDDPGFTL